MPYAVFIIKPDGSITKTLQPKAPDYQQLRTAVSGMIQTIPYFTKLTHDGETFVRGTAYANEEGLLMSLPYNPNATQAWKASLKGNYDPSMIHLVGDVIFYAKVPNASDRPTIASGAKSPKERREA